VGKRKLLVVWIGLVAAAALSQVGQGGADKVQIGHGSVSALARAARAGDTLPAEVLTYPFAEHNFASANGAGSRLVQDGALKIYVVPGKAGMLCLVEIDSLSATSGGACADRRVLLTGSIYMADRREDGSRQVVGLVGDGHTYAEVGTRRAAVTNNVFVLPAVRGDTVTIGSAQAEQTVDIGD
jgi:hypothetical protein